MIDIKYKLLKYAWPINSIQSQFVDIFPLIVKPIRDNPDQRINKDLVFTFQQYVVHIEYW